MVKTDQLLARVRTYIFPATVGLVSLIAQLIIMRRLIIVFGGNELVCGAAFAGWLAFAGLGKIFGRLLLNRVNDRVWFITILFFFMAFAIPITTAATYLIKPVLGISPQDETHLLTIFAIAIPLMAPRGLLIGATSALWRNLACDPTIYCSVRSKIALALGTAMGGIIYSLIIVHLLNPISAAILVGFILIVVVGFALGPSLKRTTAIILSLAMILLGIFGSGIEYKFAEIQWWGRDLIIQKSTGLFELAVIQNGTERTLYQDGYPSFTLPAPESYETVAGLPLLEHPKAKNIAIIGGGVSGMIDQWKTADLENALFIRADKEITKLEREDMESNIEDLPGWARILHGDARNVLRSDIEDNTSIPCLDLIIINVGNTGTASRDRFFTTNFFDEAKEALCEDGVIAMALPGIETSSGKESMMDVGSIQRSIVESFKYEAIVPLEKLFFFASNELGALTSDFTEIRKRLLGSDTTSDYFISWVLSGENEENAAKTVRGIKAASENALLNTDIQPTAYRLGMIEMERFDRWPLAIALALILTLSLLIFRQHKEGLRVTWVLGTLGLASITFELVLLIRYQMETGLLMMNIGYVLAAYSIGISLGAAAGRAWIASMNRSDKVLMMAIAFFATYTFAGIIFMKAGFAPTNILLGSLAGWIYAFTVHPIHATSKSEDVGKKIFINSHNWGALAGTIVVSTTIIPLFGLQGSLIMASISLAAGLVVVVATRE